MKKLLLLSLLAGMVILSLGVGKAEALTTTLTDGTTSVQVDATATPVGGLWLYSYTLTYIDHLIYDFRLYGTGGFPVSEITVPNSHWTYTVPLFGSYLTWVTADPGSDPLTSSNSPLSGFSFKSFGPPGIISAEAWDGTHIYGNTLGPTPEPGSMALLGMGLFGFVGGVIRKRFKA